MNLFLIKAKLFFKHHANLRLLSMSVLLLVNCFLYQFIYLNTPEKFDGAFEIGEIFNILSLSLIAAYIFYFINQEIPSFSGKIKSYVNFYNRKNNISHFVHTLIIPFFQSDFDATEKKFKDTDFEVKCNHLKAKLKDAYFQSKGIPANQYPDLDKEIVNVIVEKHMKEVSQTFNNIQNEFNSLNIHYRFLPSKLSILIAYVQDYEIFKVTYMIFSLGEMVDKKEWDYDTFAKEYVSLIDHLIEFLDILREEINPYWVLHKDKTVLDILKNK